MKKYLQTILIFTIIFWLSACSSPRDNAEDAKLIAKAWVSNNIENIADVASQTISKDYSFAVKAGIKLAIKEGINYTYSTQKIRKDFWRVEVAIGKTLDMNAIGISKKAELSGVVFLSINTDKQTVVEYELDSKRFTAKLTDTVSAQNSTSETSSQGGSASIKGDRSSYPNDIAELLRLSRLSLDDEVRVNVLEKDLSFFSPCAVAEDRMAFVCNHFPFVVTTRSKIAIPSDGVFSAKSITVLLPCKEEVTDECKNLKDRVARVPTLRSHLKSADISTIEGYGEKKFTIFEWERN
jgi:hypothetical protein